MYIADALQVITENTAKQVGGSYIQSKYGDLLSPRKSNSKPERTSKEVINSISNKIKAIGNQ